MKNKQEEPKQEGYICPQTKIQCDDECCVSAEDCHITSSLASGMVDCDELKQEWQQERMYSEEDMIEFSQWISHEDWVYLPSKGYWVNEEQEELEQKLNSKEVLNMWFEQFKKK